MILLPYSTLSVLLRTSSLLPPLFLCFSFGTKRTSVRHKENNNNNNNDRNNNNKQATQLFFFVIPCRMISARKYPETKVLSIVLVQLRCYTNNLDDIFLLIHKSFQYLIVFFEVIYIFNSIFCKYCLSIFFFFSNRNNQLRFSYLCIYFLFYLLFYFPLQLQK